MKNRMHLEFESKSENESFARVVAAAFATKLDPTVEEIEDIKTAVSEAVTNSIIHGYRGSSGIITMNMEINSNNVYIEIIDEGIGIENVKKAMEPLYTSRPEEERSGMGFSFMEIFMDKLEVESESKKGTIVKMTKIIKRV